MNHVKFPNGENLIHSNMINVEKEINNQREKKTKIPGHFFPQKTNIKSFN